MSLDTNDNPSNQEKPQAVDYAPAGTRRPLARRVLRHPLFWGIVTILFLGVCLDWGGQYDICTQCGTERTCEYVSLFAMSWRYDERITTGPVSKRIQAHLGKPCHHRWITCSYSGRWINAHGIGLPNEFHDMGILPDCDAFLDKQIAKDPAFMQKLIQAIQAPNKHWAFWESLQTEIQSERKRQMAPLSSQSLPASQPASQPAHSAPQ